MTSKSSFVKKLVSGFTSGMILYKFCFLHKKLIKMIKFSYDTIVSLLTNRLFYKIIVRIAIQIIL